MKKDSLGDRMKMYYEDRGRFYLTRRTPVIMRLDGKAFHTFTRKSEKPFDLKIINSMNETAKVLMGEIQGAKIAYVQSDEISILITDYDKLETQAWFDYNVQKMVSVAASVAGVNFTQYFAMHHVSWEFRPAYFDARVFNIPKEEVLNYFRWRQQDWKRNSIAMLAQSLYSQKELNGASRAKQLDLCLQKGHDWYELSDFKRYGTTVYSDGSIRAFDFQRMDDAQELSFAFAIDPPKSILDK